MRFVDPALQNALASWRQNPNHRERSAADNLWFEERIGRVRQALFETLVNRAGAPDALPDRHDWYWKRFVRTDDPTSHTFDSDLEPAALEPYALEPFQPIVRLEELGTPLGEQGISFAVLQTAWNDPEQSAVVEDFLDQWNDARDYRPAFAAWKDQVLVELAAADWADRMRDRLGLAHYDPTDKPIPVALMEYTVRDVMAEAIRHGCHRPFTAPTVLDSGPWPYFFPAPRELPYGRTMPLTAMAGDEQLLAEMLHFRLTYRRAHIVRLGLIRRRHGVSNLKELRNHHLVALQLASERYDFGEEIL